MRIKCLRKDWKVARTAGMRIISILCGLTLSAVGQDMAMIQAEALKKWPSDEKMQAHVVKGELKGFKELGEFRTDGVVDAKSLKWLREVALKKWPKSYGMQAYVIRGEIKAGHGLANFKRPVKMTKVELDGIFERAGKKWEEWSMILHIVKKETEAWETLRAFWLKNPTRNREILQVIEKQWPDDYGMQVYELKQLVK